MPQRKASTSASGRKAPPTTPPVRTTASRQTSFWVLAVVPVLVLPFLYWGPALWAHRSELVMPVERIWRTPIDDICRLRDSGAIDDLRCEFHALEDVNHQLAPLIRQIAQASFFKYYRVDLYRPCSFWNSDGLCVLRDCEVKPADDSEIPVEWTTAAGEDRGANHPIDQVDFAPFGKSYQPFGATCDYEDSDFCVLGDERSANGVYVDLLKNPERFTGYAGPSANSVWEAIYEENCFDVPARLKALASSQNVVTEFSQFESLQRHRQALLNECKEKRVFYRVVSGLHASISTHLCREYFNQTTQEWGPNLDCFMSRVGHFPDRLQNIYFNYALLLRSVFRLSSYFLDREFCTGNKEEDAWLKAKIQDLVATCLALPDGFDENELFLDSQAAYLKEEFKDNFRNVTRIMDC
ncbi:endoplasmic oxidoreductin-1, partial [Dimargaris xerosporica]